MKKFFASLLVAAIAAFGLFGQSQLSAATFEGRMKMQVQPEKGKPTVMSYAMKGQRVRMEIPGEAPMVGLLDWEKREMSMLF